ncbi:MAG: nuclear transport factor 2 family protein [Bacteroidetes bacterium]|nr:MAG: nuclear transport factor 2 family protein [Bacteroidota bacterium]TAG89059.1 MAG: nuclear transport factor 2 family protein [Bacteroidota bacterium]
MNTNENLIKTLYTSFQQKDYATLRNCYDDKAVFSDTIFPNLNANEVRNMWEMLLSRGKDLTLEFKNIVANDKNGSAEWIATYTFSGTGNKVINHIKADFEFENGKITKHTEHFDFYTWARQALGYMGFFLGWTTYLHQKVQKTANENLKKFINKK